MITFAEISPAVVAASISAAVSLFGILVGLWINGDRAERQRRRELHARSLAAALSYGEMPFMIRRRRWEEDAQSSERVRLSDHLSAVKAELSTCQVLLSADGDRQVSRAYDELIHVARATAGAEAHAAWKDPAIKTDAEMNMGPLFDRLADFRRELLAFEQALGQATLPRRLRLQHQLRRDSSS
ncbi:MAG: hypothetical protein WDZ46_03810 [Solirubrobacterales bacterium]